MATNRMIDGMQEAASATGVTRVGVAKNGSHNVPQAPAHRLTPLSVQQRAHHVVAAGEDLAIALGILAEAARARNLRRGDATARAGLRAVTRAYARMFCNALPDADPQVIESLVALCSTETARALAARREGRRESEEAEG